MFGRKTWLGLLAATVVAAGTVGGGTPVWAASAKPALSIGPTAIPGLHLVLPQSGTYLITADVRGVLVQTAAHDCFLMAQLARGAPGTPVPNTERTVVTDFARNGTVVDGTAPIQTIVTTTVANTVVEVEAFAVNSLGGACAGVGQIIADQHGAGTLNAVRIS